MNNQTDENRIAGVDFSTFLGVLLAVTGVFGIIAVVLTGQVPALAMGGLAFAGATVTVFGHSLIAKGMGYRAVLSSIKQHPGLWVFTLAMGAVGGSIMLGTVVMLLNAKS